ncbi:MAG: hypothetical protein IPH74_05645 [Bacteroidetes bacterium]|nr:hypothetical protein [Bacteroidota bacterium]
MVHGICVNPYPTTPPTINQNHFVTQKILAFANSVLFSPHLNQFSGPTTDIFSPIYYTFDNGANQLIETKGNFILLAFQNITIRHMVDPNF